MGIEYMTKKIGTPVSLQKKGYRGKVWVQVFSNAQNDWMPHGVPGVYNVSICSDHPRPRNYESLNIPQFYVKGSEAAKIRADILLDDLQRE